MMYSFVTIRYSVFCVCFLFFSVPNQISCKQFFYYSGLKTLTYYKI